MEGLESPRARTGTQTSAHRWRVHRIDPRGSRRENSRPRPSSVPLRLRPTAGGAHSAQTGHVRGASGRDGPASVSKVPCVPCSLEALPIIRLPVWGRRACQGPVSITEPTGDRGGLTRSARPALRYRRYPQPWWRCHASLEAAARVWAEPSRSDSDFSTRTARFWSRPLVAFRSRPRISSRSTSMLQGSGHASACSLPRRLRTRLSSRRRGHR